MSKIVAINGSPRMGKGNTATILNPFLEGMVKAGAGVELVYASRLKVKPCQGEFHCWYTRPGECHIEDDMQTLLPRLKEATILVLATPVYIPLPGAMQNLINRLCPLIDPFLVTRDGRTRARFHKEVEIEKIVLVSTSGWWEMGNFGTVVRIVEELAEDASVEFAGAVLRPHAFLMKENATLTPEGQAVERAANRAGYELVREGKLATETLAQIGRPLIAQEELRQRYNRALQ